MKVNEYGRYNLIKHTCGAKFFFYLISNKRMWITMLITYQIKTMKKRLGWYG